MPDLIANSDTIPLSPQEPRPADPPFDDQDADLIIRSCDMVDFRVHRVILSLASPKLKAMITALSSTPSPHILALPEDAHTIDYILRCSYPIAIPKLRSLHDIRAVLFAAVEHDISEVIKIAKLALSGHIQQDAVGTFAIATRCKLHDVCTMAAKHFAKKSFLSLDSSELDLISAYSYHNLVQFHPDYDKRHTRSTHPASSKEYWLSNWPDPTKTTPNSTPGSQTRLAEDPFNDETADIILHSCDNVRFCVFKNILSIASPFFHDMFSLPQALSSSDDASVIHMPEDARTIDFLLRLCYPVAKPSLTELEDLRLVLDAARKYDMVTAIDSAKVALEQLVDENVLGVFAVAVHCELRDICSTAARRYRLYSGSALDPEELEHICARQYHRLLQYHQRCRTVALAITIPECDAWFSRETFRVDDGPTFEGFCGACQVGVPWSACPAPVQVWEYMERAAEALKSCPHRSAVLTKEVLDAWKPSVIRCPACEQLYSRDRCSQALANAVEEAVSKVEMPHFF